MSSKPWQIALAVGLLVLFVGLLGFRFLGSTAPPTFEKTPAGSSPDVQSSQTP